MAARASVAGGTFAKHAGVTTERHERLMALFDHACDLPPAERDRFVAGPDVDDDLREELRAMLAEDARSRVFFDVTAGAAELIARDMVHSALAHQDGPAPSPDAPLPERIGEYRITRRIGAGGMGTVYEAEQSEPRRRVALKTLHPWLVTPRTLERFRFEAHALARLQHPGIPPVYTVGEDGGQVYFAMELVEGPTLLDWIQRQRLDERARMELLVEICEAVHHAHLRGVVHRDIKPDNIRVTAGGRPKVLDFGISLAIQGGPTVFDARDVSGTIGYMSPEQVDPERPIDVRSDVWSLGVIAYEMLTGRKPVDLSGMTIEDALTAMRSPRFLPLDERRPDLPSDLGSVLGRALAVDPADRYASAADFAADLRAWLDGRAVAAHPRTTGYVLRKLVGRHRTVVALGSALALTVIGAAVTSYGAYRRAEHARAMEAAERAAAEDARREAEQAAARAEATLRFVTDLLTEADPERTLGRKVTVEQAVDRAVARLEAGTLASEPRVEASVRATAGEVYSALGAPDRAEAQFHRVIGLYDTRGLKPDAAYATALRMLAISDWEAGHYERAAERMRRVIAIEQELSHGAPTARLAEALHVYAMTLREAGDMRGARSVFARSNAMNAALYARGEIDPDQLAAGYNQYAYVLLLTGQLEAAGRLYRRALAVDLERYGPSHPEVATDYHHVAFHEATTGHCEEALRRLDEAYAIRSRALGPDHIRIGIQRSLRARCEVELGRITEAEASLAEALRIVGATYGTSHPRYTRALETRVRILLARGRPADAVALARRITRAHETSQGESHWVTAASRGLLGQALVAAGSTADGRAQLERAARDLEGQLGPDTPLLAGIRPQLAALSRGSPPRLSEGP